MFIQNTYILDFLLGVMSGMAPNEHRSMILWFILGILTAGLLLFVYTVLSTATYNRAVGEGGNKTLSQWFYLILLIPFIGGLIFLILFLVINYQRFSGIREATGEGITPILIILPIFGMLILEFSYNKLLYGEKA